MILPLFYCARWNFLDHRDAYFVCVQQLIPVIRKSVDMGLEIPFLMFRGQLCEI